MRGVPWRPVLAAALVGTALLGTPAPAAQSHSTPAAGRADLVLAWSGYAQQAIVAEAPATSPVLLGIAHVAMFDTAVALGLPAEPFLHREPAARHVSADAEFVIAATDVVNEDSTVSGCCGPVVVRGLASSAATGLRCRLLRFASPRGRLRLWAVPSLASGVSIGAIRRSSRPIRVTRRRQSLLRMNPWPMPSYR